jgi:hypothetical protein
VHGIGAQRRGETVAKLIAGLQRVDPAFAAGGSDGVLTLDGRPLRLYEVYWSNLLSGKRIRGTFNIFELMSVSWFPLLNWMRKTYARRAWPLLMLAWSLVLPFFNFLMLFGYYGAGFLIGVFRAMVRAARERGRRDHEDALAFVNEMLDEYAADVFNYVNSAAGAFYREEDERPVPAAVQRVHPRIMRRFYAQLVKANEDGCGEIHIVAHSLGTVVAYHALSGLNLEQAGCDADAVRAACAKVRHIYTIGSPLEKIRFFWPRLMRDAAILGGAKIEWDNFVSRFDPVAGRLRPMFAGGELRNHHLLGGGFVTGHVVYERSGRFLAAFTRGLLGRELPLRETRAERRRDLLVLFGETLVTPLVLILTLVVGAAFFLITAGLIPYVLSWLLRPFLTEASRVAVVHVTFYLFLGMMTFAIFTTALLRAWKVHKRYWSAPQGE